MDVRHLCLVAAALICLGLVACGDDDETTVTETVQSTTGAETATAETTGTATQAEAGEAPGTPTTPYSSPGKRGPKYFESPSHNIGCYVSGSGARCDIMERDWEPPPKPKFCVKAGVDWGQGIGLGKKGADFVCAGDTAFGGKATLEYGRVSQRGIYLCESEESGMTCSNVKNGAGFFLSREEYRIF